MTPIAGMLLSVTASIFVPSRGGHLWYGIEADHGCVDDIEATNADPNFSDPIANIFRKKHEDGFPAPLFTCLVWKKQFILKLF